MKSVKRYAWNATNINKGILHKNHSILANLVLNS